MGVDLIIFFHTGFLWTYKRSEFETLYVKLLWQEQWSSRGGTPFPQIISGQGGTVIQ